MFSNKDLQALVKSVNNKTEIRQRLLARRFHVLSRTNILENQPRNTEMKTKKSMPN